jgi:ApbE superfamily uncharacterized protein (UPF0280 family)
MSGPAAAWLPGRRLHLQHGPIDLVIGAFGPEAERVAAYRQAWTAFRTVLDDLVAVLPLLRTDVSVLGGRLATDALENPLGRGYSPPASRPLFPPGSVADRMLRATAPHAPVFVTPMAAVAGAVADHVLEVMTAGRRLERVYVNNGGDAALWLSSGVELAAAGGPGLADRIRVTAESPVRGIATSGWRGRSHSLGIADAVTVLARTAADADAAATLVANAVDLPGHPGIRRRPARELSPDSDLGGRPVTVAVGPLARAEIARALAAGRRSAEAMMARGLIEAAALWLGGQVETVGIGAALPSPVSAGP